MTPSRTLSLALTCFLLTATACTLADDSPGYLVESPTLHLHLSPDGKIVAAKSDSEQDEHAIAGETILAGCKSVGTPRAARLPNGGIEFTKRFVDKSGNHQASLVERFVPTKTSVRWEIEVHGEGRPWSAPIETSLACPKPDQTQFWTAWGDPRPNGADWTNPLRPADWTDREFLYGGHSYFKEPGTFSLPLATILDEKNDAGLSLVNSPEDLVLTMKMRTTRQGRVTFLRENHRLGQGDVVRCAFDLVSHPADWRCGVAWLSDRYPAFFNSPNPAAQQMAGCGAYSSHADIGDAERLMRMAFRVNWKASFDFPYMGMFIPPVTSDTEEWTDFAQQKISIAKMRASAQELRRMGFYMLNYFNVTEFGAYTKFPAPPRKAANDADLWKDSNDFLHNVMSKAILPGPNGKSIGSWEGCVVMDCGEKIYQDFLVDQARRHIEKFPESSGICIDRMDWIWSYNRQRDDGLTWFENKPARSLVVSWHELMNRLGPVMHDAGKVIFGNPMYARLDLMRHLDGFYDEHGQHPHSINTCSILALNKPYMAWTWEPEHIGKDPDAYFQRHLYLGAYLTAPVVGNDHTIQPDAKLDQLFFDYGPMLDALRGKRWVLLPHVVRVNNSQALANVFEIPGGYVVPVMLGGKETAIEIELQNLPMLPGQGGFRAEILHPGSSQPLEISTKTEGSLLRVPVPLQRGCAMLLLTHTWMSPKAAYFHDAAKVELGTLLKDVELRYTLDGAEPTPQSPVYTAPLELRQTTVVKAAAFRDNQKLGRTLEREYVAIPPSAKSSSLTTTPLGALAPDSVQQGWGELRIDASVLGKTLKIGDRIFARGFGTHANSEIVFNLDQPCERFEAWVGVDNEIDYTKAASVVFKVLGDGRELFDSGVMRSDSPAKRVSVSLAGVTQLRLVATDAGDGNDSDHADWAEPVLLSKPETGEAAKPIRFTVASPKLTLGLTEDGDIGSIESGDFKQSINGGPRLSACKIEGKPTVERLDGGGLLVSRRLRHAKGHTCTLTERFTPTGDGVRWESEITSNDSPWTTPIATRLACDKPEELRLWTAWADPQRRADAWRDPLEMIPLPDRYWHYGNAAQVAPIGGDFISLPLLTLASPKTNRAFSVILSPEDVLLNMTLAVSTNGQVRFTRVNHRLGGGKSVRFTTHLIGHEADWRGGLRWMADQYPALFNPPNPRVDSIAGCAAYSGDEHPIDVAKFKKMAFRINWKLSDDFPYMGMFIPPVKDVDQRWTRSCDEAAAPDKPATTSCRQLNDYARWMHKNGFHVLSYFNVTEFGKNMKDVDVSNLRADDPELWKNPVAYLKLQMPNGYLKPPMLTCYGAWLTDVGDPAYCRFMLEQAKRNIELLPDTDGICIDRLDWLRLYNPDGDDGVSWIDGRPARSLYRSWIAFSDQLGPLMHNADKLIFANTMTMRLELNRHIDGIYTEHGDNPGALNAAALMGIRKPVLAWTYRETLDQPDPDSFFQRHLHLGVFPTAPYPLNNHCITPDPTADRHYMDYGPLLDVMRGRKWVLSAQCVEPVSPNIKVNLFQTPNGYALPVTFGGKANSATVRLRNIPKLESLQAKALHPGDETEQAVSTVFKDGVLELQVPLKHGCAMVILK